MTLVGVLLDCHVRQNCFQLGLNCCFPIFDNGELHIPLHLWLDFRLPSHLTMGRHFCQNCHIPMTQLLSILRQKEHYSFFFYAKLNATHTHDIEPINVAYLGVARRSYNVSKKTRVFSRLTSLLQLWWIVMLQRIKKSLNDYSLFSSGVRLFNFNQVALQFTTPVFNCFQISFTSILI